MTNEETYLKEKVGNRNPFQVPNGYFEQFANQVMQQLPEREVKKSRIVALRPLLYAAACIVVLVVMGVTWLMPKDAVEPAMAEVNTPLTTAPAENSYFDDAADYAMLDNVAIYACLTEN